MCDLSCFDKNHCQKAAQFLVTIIIVLIVGFLVSALPVMTQLDIVKNISAADLIVFISKSAALVLLFLFARHAKAAIPENEGLLAFFRGITIPCTALIILIIGQNLLWQLIDHFVRSTGETVYSVIAILLILAVTIWLMLNAYRDAPFLIETLQRRVKQFSSKPTEQYKNCSACNKPVPGHAKFCHHCGHIMSTQIKCNGCGNPVSEEQKFCTQCGVAIENFAE